MPIAAVAPGKMEDEAEMADDQARRGVGVSGHRPPGQLDLLGARQTRLALDLVDEAGPTLEQHGAGTPVKAGERIA